MKNVRNYLGHKVKSIDSFGVPIRLRVNGQEEQKTYFGAFMSLLVLAVTLIYAVKRYDVMVGRLDTVHQSIKESVEFKEK